MGKAICPSHIKDNRKEARELLYSRAAVIITCEHTSHLMSFLQATALLFTGI
jgi:hypothetical protein